MLLIKLNRRLSTKNPSIIRIIRHTSSAVTPNTNALTQDVTYPPITDVSFAGRFRKYQEDKHETVKKLKTVEEKQIKINIARYWGYRMVMYQEGELYYNELPHAQYITRTHVIEEPKLPEVYDNLVDSEKLDGLVRDVKDCFENGIAFELDARNWSQEYSEDTRKKPHVQEDMRCEAVAKQANRILMAYLSKDYPHLLETDVQYDPRIEAYWMAGGLHLHREIVRGRKKRGWKTVLTEPADRPLQYVGSPALQLRHKLPLKEITSLSLCENSEFAVPEFKYDPRSLGRYFRRRHGTNIPGFWPGDVHEFGLMSYHKRGYLLINNRINDEIDALKAQALYASWGWLSGQACNQGFSTFNDVTYPLVNQLIITNGQWWSFSVYQLNTTLVNTWYNDSNPKSNIMWMTEPMKLYETIEDGKLVGVNDDVLRTLIKFYANKPEERVGIDLKPYLGETEKIIADIEDKERRVWLEERFKLLMSNRPRHRLPPELYQWEWIYKHRFNTCPLDKRRTPWDYGLNPYQRLLNDHFSKYIPKAQRPQGKFRQKWTKTYYP